VAVTGPTPVRRYCQLSGIKRAGEGQSAGTDQINRAITTMDAATQQNIALVEAAAAAESVREQAGQQEPLVSTFHLAGAPASAANSRALMLRA
jgi:hypothetical protein